MRRTHYLLAGAFAASALALGPAVASANTVVDDHFDDGDATTNTNGIGTGFSTATFGDGLFSESGTNLTVEGDSDGNDITRAVSKEGADLTSGSFTYNWTISEMRPETDDFQNRSVGIVDNDSTNFSEGPTRSNKAGNSPNNIGVEFIEGNPGDNTGELVFQDNGGTFTQLAQWDWNNDLGVDIAGSTVTDVIDISLGVSNSGGNYALSIEAGSNSLDESELTSGSLTGSLSNFTADDGRAYFYHQGAGATDADRVSIVPAPGALPVALALVGGVTMIRRRRKA
jgi:MYXO-CTERM domain-containing protein